MTIREHAIFRHVTHPEPDVAMGGCYIYHTAGPGVDTGVLIEFEGTLFLSDLVIKELAECAGMNVLEDAIALEKEMVFTEAVNKELTQRIVELESELEESNALIGAATTRVKRPQAKR